MTRSSTLWSNSPLKEPTVEWGTEESVGKWRDLCVQDSLIAFDKQLWLLLHQLCNSICSVKGFQWSWLHQACGIKGFPDISQAATVVRSRIYFQRRVIGAPCSGSLRGALSRMLVQPELWWDFPARFYRLPPHAFKQVSNTEEACPGDEGLRCGWISQLNIIEISQRCRSGVP